MANFEAIEEAICENLWANNGRLINELLPNFGFVARGKFLQSSQTLSGESRNRKDKTKIGRGKKNKNSLVLFEQGGEEHNLINWLQSNYYKASYKETIMELSKLCKVEVGSPEDWKKYEEAKERKINLRGQLSSILAKARNEMFTAEGKEIYNYLISRGYTEDRIKAEGLGAISSTVKGQIEALAKYLEEKDGDNKGRGALWTVSHYAPEETKYKLLIEFKAEGQTAGFIVRSLQSQQFLDSLGDKEHYYPKYQQASPIIETASDVYLFGFDSGEIDITKPLIIVEGALDCLSAKYIGLKNVVALCNSSFSDVQCKYLKRNNIKAVAFLLDTEDTEEKRANMFQKVLNFSQLLAKENIFTYFAFLPSPEGTKCDVNSFVSAGGTLEQLENILNNAKSANCAFAEIAIEHYKESPRSEFDKRQLTAEVIPQLLQLKDPLEKLAIKKSLISEVGEEMYETCINAEVEAQREEGLTAQIKEASNRGDFSKVEVLLRQLKASNKEKDKASEIVEVIKARPASAEGWINEYWSKTAEDILTSYVLKSTAETFDALRLPVGALTLVGAGTSHGKSTFLQNLALDLLKERKFLNGKVQEEAGAITGKILYFSLEESRRETEIKMFNIFLGEAETEISANRKKSLKYYYGHYRDKDRAKYFSEDYYNNYFGDFQLKEEKFFTEYLTSGRLTVIDTEELGEKTASRIISVTEEIMQTETVGAVFVDFLQELEAEEANKTSLKRLELKESAELLKDFAVKYNLPVICAVQLNREANSPLTLHPHQIAESIDIPRYASLIIQLYNSDFPVTKEPSGEYYFKQSKSEGDPLLSDFPLTGKAKALEERGWLAGRRGAIFARVTKNRGGELNSTAVMAFNGNSGVIESEVIVSKEQRVEGAQKEMEDIADKIINGCPF